MRRPSQMSGGQQQRVGIARALVNKAKIIFADEPTGNLDSNTTLDVMKLIVGISKKNNQTIILVTHDNSIADYADKIVEIKDGNIINVVQKEKKNDTTYRFDTCNRDAFSIFLSTNFYSLLWDVR